MDTSDLHSQTRGGGGGVYDVIAIINTFRWLFKASDTFYVFQALIKMADSHRNCQHHQDVKTGYVLRTFKSVLTLFNTSLSTGIVPFKFEIANVIPIHKKDSHTDLCNYRPISLLSTCNKLLEKNCVWWTLKISRKGKDAFSRSVWLPF